MNKQIVTSLPNRRYLQNSNNCSTRSVRNMSAKYFAKPKMNTASKLQQRIAK